MKLGSAQFRRMNHLLGWIALFGYFCYQMAQKESPIVLTRFGGDSDVIQSYTGNTTAELNNDTYSSYIIGEGATRICTQAERLAHLKWYCEKKYQASKANLMTPVGRTLVDRQHNLTFCWLAKAACTAIKAFILESKGLTLSEKISLEDSLNQLHFSDTIHRHGIKQMYEMIPESQWEIVNSYHNMFAIRHPFDRLVSYYWDKLVDSDRASNNPKRQSEILRFSRPQLFENNTALDAMEFPQSILGPPTFEEFMNWTYQMKRTDDHWSFITETCHPCAHDWEAILRVETMAEDGQFLAKVLKINETQIPVRHSHEEGRDFMQFDRHLVMFENVTSEVVDYWLDFFYTDMDMFGYHWERDTLMATCSIKTPNGTCC